LGQTRLNHNPITNPVQDFKYNKYLYRDISATDKDPSYASAAGNFSYNNNLSRSLVKTGNIIIS